MLASTALVVTTLALPAQGASQFADIDRESLQQYSGRLEIKQDNTVIDGLLVKGYIDIKADNVTIKNTIVESTSYNSIRIYEGADGSKIQNTQVFCMDERSNGVAHGDYTADRVDLFNCRHDFYFTADRPATVTNSSIDGIAYSTEDSSPTAEPSVTSAPAPAPEPTVTNEPAPAPEPTTAPTTVAPSVEPTASASPSAAPTTSGPSYSGFPDASNTGVPAGVTLRPSSGMEITTPGTVIDALDVQGSIVIRADNVTIKNSRVTTESRYPIHVTQGVTGTVIDHVEVSNADSNGKGIYFNGGTGTVRYSDIHSAEDGVFIVADGVTLEHNYIHDLTRHSGAHPDTIQIRAGDNITIRHNNLQAYTASIGVMNAAIQIGSLVGTDTITNLRVTDNLMNGGHVTVNGGGRGEVDSATYSNNRFGRDHQYSVQANVQNSVWAASNVYDDNGQPAR